MLPAWLALCASACYRICILETGLKVLTFLLLLMIKGAVIQYFCIVITGIVFITVLYICLLSTGRDCNSHQNKQATDGRAC